jgi:hypothetical protein
MLCFTQTRIKFVTKIEILFFGYLRNFKVRKKTLTKTTAFDKKTNKNHNIVE